MASNNGPVRLLGLVFAVAVLARLGVQAVTNAFAHPTVWEYEEIASNLVAGRGYTYASPDGGTYVGSQSSPMYIAITAGVYLVSGHSHVAILVLQALLGGVTAALVAWLGARVFSRGAGFAAGMLVALDPALLIYAAELHSLTFDALANVALLCGTVAMPRRPGPVRLGGLGVAFGLAALTRATALVLLPVSLLWLCRYRGVRLISLGAACMLLFGVLCYAPWPARNSVLLGQLMFGSSDSSEWFWRGNNPNATGASLAADGQRMLDLAPAEFRAEVAAADEAQRMTLYGDAAAQFVRADPWRTVGLFVMKLRDFWWGSVATGLLYPPVWLLAYRVWYVTMVLTAAWGAWSARRDPDQRSVVLLIGCMLLIISAAQAVFYVEGRHRFAIEPVLLVLAGAGIAQLCRGFMTGVLHRRQTQPTGQPAPSAPLP
jgi:4-amino-4-deoxy-L-arabinose transferase-like glycosyltransferase